MVPIQKMVKYMGKKGESYTLYYQAGYGHRPGSDWSTVGCVPTVVKKTKTFTTYIGGVTLSEDLHTPKSLKEILCSGMHMMVGMIEHAFGSEAWYQGAGPTSKKLRYATRRTSLGQNSGYIPECPSILGWIWWPIR